VFWQFQYRIPFGEPSGTQVFVSLQNQKNVRMYEYNTLTVSSSSLCTIRLSCWLLRRQSGFSYNLQ